MDPQRGKHVSRSVYQKQKEENKRLLKDIRILTGPISAERILLVAKWRSRFRKEERMNKFIKGLLIAYRDTNPNVDINQN